MGCLKKDVHFTEWVYCVMNIIEIYKAKQSTKPVYVLQSIPQISAENNVFALRQKTFKLEVCFSFAYVL